MLERLQKASRGEAEPVYHLERMAIATAYNYCKDMRRRDKRLYRTSNDVCVLTTASFPVDPSEQATEQAYQEVLFILLAQEIARFPVQQKRALLTELANRMCFETELSPLQRAFACAGISLQEYRQTQSTDPRQKCKDAALLHCAYKRIANLTSLQKYTAK